MASDIPTQKPPAPSIRVLAQFARAVSFVTKDGVQVFGLKGTPNIDLGVDVGSDPVQGQENVYETTLKLMARAHVDNDTMFELDLAYAGVFDVSGAPSDRVDSLLMVDCPNLLFPFARRMIADISREGGFPPLLVDPIDFAGLYRQQLAERQAGSPPAGG